MCFPERRQTWPATDQCGATSTAVRPMKTSSGRRRGCVSFRNRHRPWRRDIRLTTSSTIRRSSFGPKSTEVGTPQRGADHAARGLLRLLRGDGVDTHPRPRRERVRRAGRDGGPVPPAVAPVRARAARALGEHSVCRRSHSERHEGRRLWAHVVWPSTWPEFSLARLGRLAPDHGIRRRCANCAGGIGVRSNLSLAMPTLFRLWTIP